MKKPLTIMALADLHVGSIFCGVYPPDWQAVPHGFPGGPLLEKAQAEAYETFRGYTSSVKPDILLINGDVIDGCGERAGGLEMVYPDRQKQVECAVKVIKEIGAREIYMTRGTPYHVGQAEDWENTIARDVKADAIADVLQVDFRGVVFHLRHHVGTSGIPQGGGNTLGREINWQKIRAAEGDEARADILCFAHVHKHKAYAEDGVLAMTLPGLQLRGGKYPARRLSSRTDFGVVVFEIESRDAWLREKTWRTLMRPVKAECLPLHHGGAKKR